MPITRSRQLIYQLFALVMLLLLLYSGLVLMVAIKFLPDDPLVGSLVYSHLAPWRDVTLQLLLLTGAIGGGLYMTLSTRPSGIFNQEILLQWVVRGWFVLVTLAMLAGALNLLEGRESLSLPRILDVMLLLLLLAFMTIVLINPPNETDAPTAFTFVWLIGILIYGLALVVGLIPVADYMLDRILRLIALNLMQHVALPLIGLSMAFWLMTRFSHVMRSRAAESLYTVAGLAAIAGAMVSFMPIFATGIPTVPAYLALLLVPICYVIITAHSYRAFAQHNATQTLSAHPVALFIVLLFCAIAILGTVTMLPGIQALAQGTRLTDLKSWLIAWSLIAVILGMINQGVAEMRGLNERIMGLLPFWLIAAGVFISGAALTLAGVVQLYMERLLSIGYLDTQKALIPLYVFWIMGGFVLATGALIAAAGFHRRAVLEKSAQISESASV